MTPRMVFEQELEALKTRVSEMGERAQLGYQRLLLAIQKNDRSVMLQLLDSDRQMIDMQREIESKSLSILTRQQPVARDLRLVSSALKVVTDIERVGDHVADIAELFLRFREAMGESTLEKDIEQMMSEAGHMFRSAIEAFVEADEEAARRVVARDDIVDRLFNQVKEEMMEAITAQSLDADKVVDYLMVAKYLEKIGDHAVNIAEWAMFRVTGDMQGQKLY